MTSVSLDISYELFKLAKKKKCIDKILVGDAEFMPFRDRTFDCIVGVSILYHLSIEKVLKEIMRVLKKKGERCFV